MPDADNDAAAAAMPDGVPDDAAKVFLSYSRRDREKAQRIAEALRARSFGVFRDTDDILPTEEWKDRLEELIAEADTIVFLLSPHSAVSEVCAWEVEHASALNKRIAPIVIDEVAAEAIPPKLARLNFIFCTARDPFENAVATLASALNTDIDWVREHTRLGGLARRWQAANAPARLLLRGQDIADAEAWRDARPAEAPTVTPDQARFVAESRRAAGRRQRTWAAGAFAVAAVTAGLAVFAYVQKQEADGQRAAADASAIEAARQRDAAEARLREANVERTRRSVADAGASLGASQMEQAAALVRGAIDAALDLGDAELTEASAAMARRLVFEDRLVGYLEGGFADPLAHPTLKTAPDGASAIGRVGERLTLWSTTTGLARFAATGVAAAGYRSDGAVIGVRATPTGKGLVFSVDPASGVTAAIGRTALAPREAWIVPAAGLALLAGERDGQETLVAMDLATGAVRFEAAPALGRVRRAAASPDGGRILISGDDGGALMDAEGAIRYRFQPPAEPRHAGFAPDGDPFFFRTDRGFHLGGTADGVLRLVPAGDGPAEEVVFLGDGRIAVHRGIEPARLLDMATLEETGRLDGRISFGLVGADRARGAVVARGPQQFFVHDAMTGALRHRIGRPSPPLGGWSLSPDGRYLATLLQNGLVSVWSTETGREVMAVMPAGGAARIQMLERPGGAAVAAIDGDGRLGLWRAEDARLVFGQDVVAAEPALDRAVAANGGYGAPAAIWDVDAGMVRQAFDGAVVRSVDPATGRVLLALPEGDAVLTAPGAAPVPLDAATDRSVRDVAWGAGGRLAIRRAETIDLYDAGGRLAGSIPRAAPESALPALRFSVDGARLVFLTTRPGVAVADATTGGIVAEAALPEAGRALFVAAGGDGGFVAGADAVYRFDTAAGTASPVVDPTPASAVLAAGPHAAVLQSGGVEDRTVWLADMASGARRFSLQWRGGAYALGDRDRLLAEETAAGDLYLIDAATGEARLHVPGDGGADAVPTPPRLCPGEALALAVNGGAAMARLVDTASGRVLAGVPRREGYKAPAMPDADCGLLRLGVDGIGYVYDLADVRLDPAGLAAEIERRYPALPPPPPPDVEANECDRLAANPLDPAARVEGVAYESLTPEALAACAARFDGGAASARDAYQLARVAGRFRPDMDAATLDLLREAANAGYAAAQHALAIRLIEGRGDGEAEPAAAAVRWLQAASAGGMGAAAATLARLAEAGVVPGDADAILEAGVAAGRPAAMDAAARRLAAAYDASGDAEAAAAAARLWRKAATGFAARRQAPLARQMLDRAATLARRVAAWPKDD